MALENIHVVPKLLLGERLGGIAPGREPEVKRAPGYAFDWAELKVLRNGGYVQYCSLNYHSQVSFG